MKNSEFHHAEIPVTLTMCPPAVRMLVVLVAANRDDAGEWKTHASVYPVLALTARQSFGYDRPQAGDRLFTQGPTHQTMQSLGWRYDGGGADFVHFDAVVMDRDHGLGEASLVLDCANGARKIIVADWDPADDEEHIARVVFDLSSEAIANASKPEHQRSLTPV